MESYWKSFKGNARQMYQYKNADKRTLSYGGSIEATIKGVIELYKQNIYIVR